MRRRFYDFKIREGVPPVATLQGPAALCSPVTAGPDPFDDPDYQDYVVQQARIDDAADQMLAAACYGLSLIAFAIAAGPIWQALKAAF